MPNTGTPNDNNSTGMCGASGAYTEAGPPDRMMPPKSMDLAFSKAVRGGAISHHTLASRTRRAIN